MKLLLYLLVTFVFAIPAKSQQIYAEAGTTVSSFHYKNSQGQPLENLLSKPNTYFGMGYRDVLNDRRTLHLSIGAVYNGYGAIGSDRVLDNYFEYDVTYIGLVTGLDYRLFRLRDFSFFIKGTVSVEFLLRGTQTINNQVFNLAGEDQFNQTVFFGRAGAGMQHPISDSTLFFANYTYGKTVLIGQGNAAGQEELKLATHQFGIGIIISLPMCNCMY